MKSIQSAYKLIMKCSEYCSFLQVFSTNVFTVFARVPCLRLSCTVRLKISFINNHFNTKFLHLGFHAYHD